MIFQNILTTIGQQKRAIAETGGASLNITHFKIGDSNGQYYEPLESQIDLVNVKYTANFTGQSQILINPTSPNEVLYKCFVPAEIGGFTIRELGLFDSNNDLILICKLPAQDKFSLESGLYQPLTFTPKIIFTNPQTQAVLTVSSQIIATQNFVSQEIVNHTNDLQAHTELLSEKVNKDGSIDFTGLQKYATDLTPTDDKHLIPKKYADSIKDSIQHYPLFTSISLDHLLTGSDIVGWALADGNWLDGTVYTDAYDLLLEQYTNGTSKADTVIISNINLINVTQTINYKQGSALFKIVDISNISQADNLYAATGTADYYILDIIGQRFKLPRLNCFNQITTDPNKLGEYSKDQIVNINATFEAFSMGTSSGAINADTILGQYNCYYNTQNFRRLHTFNASKVVNTGEQVQPRNVKRFLYYKVGNTITTQSLIDVGNLISSMVSKADKDLSNITEDGKNFIKNIVPLSKLWTSVEYASSGVQTVSVPVEIDLNKCIVQVLLKCSVAQGNYSVGDYAPYNWSSGSDSNWNGANIDLTNRTIQATGGNTLFIPYKNAIGYFGGSSANWRFVFKILY